MRWLLYLAGVFINTFGITQPSEEKRDQTARYIAFLLAFVIALLCAVFAAAVYITRK